MSNQDDYDEDIFYDFDYYDEENDELNVEDNSDQIFDYFEEYEDISEEVKDEYVERPSFSTTSITNQHKLPFGLLHNDANVFIRLRNDPYTYPSVSHAVYASICSSGIERNIITNTFNVVKAKTFASSSYLKQLQDIQSSAVLVAYRKISEQTNMFRLYPSRLYTYNDTNPILSDVVTRVLNLFASKDASNMITIQRNDPLSPYYEIPFEVEGIQFNNVIQYIYFKYYEYFLDDTQQAYNSITQSNDYETTFGELQQMYLENQIQPTLRDALTYKVEQHPNVAKLLVTMFQYEPGVPQPIFEDTYPFLKDIINPFTNTYLPELLPLVSNRIDPYTSITNINVYMQDPSLKKWLMDTRLTHLLQTIEHVFRYLNKPIITRWLNLFMELFLSQCDILNKDTLVTSYPPQFYDGVRDKCSEEIWDSMTSIQHGGSENIYLLWMYISICCDMLVQKQIRLGTSFKTTIQRAREAVPTILSQYQVYTAIYKLLVYIKTMCDSTMTQFVLDDGTFTLIQNLFGIPPKPISTIQSDVAELGGINDVLLTRVERDLRMGLNISKRQIQVEKAQQVLDFMRYVHRYVNEPRKQSERSKVFFYS